MEPTLNSLLNKAPYQVAKIAITPRKSRNNAAREIRAKLVGIRVEVAKKVAVMSRMSRARASFGIRLMVKVAVKSRMSRARASFG